MSNLKVKILEATSNALGREMTVCPVLIYDEEKAVLIDSGFNLKF